MSRGEKVSGGGGGASVLPNFSRLYWDRVLSTVDSEIQFNVVCDGLRRLIAVTRVEAVVLPCWCLV